MARISPGWRKEKYNKIFRKPLTKRDKAKMAQSNLRELNPLISSLDDKKRRRLEDQAIDEAIGLDLSDLSAEDEGEDMNMSIIGSESENEGSGTSPDGVQANDKEDEREPDQYINVQEIRAAMTELFQTEREVLGLLYGNRMQGGHDKVTADMFFISHLLVPPNKYRPEARTGEGEIAEAPDNTLYKNILKASERMNQVRKEIIGIEKSEYRQRDMRDLQIAWVALQDTVNSLFDSDQSTVTGPTARLSIEGIKQKMEKKEGLFRMNMMGKRVNFAARSVISPDPNIETNEVGVPPVFARKLTFPEPVTNHNFYDLKQAVLNGVGKWPGAAAIENESGQVINLRTKNFEERQALANQLLAPSNTSVTGARNKKVHRHLANGDIVLMNRQPTLHKPSIMAHRAKVLPGEKTIRMHYANCNTYNADFDGDEMNLHFPQNEIARAEALQIADTDHQYLSATAGKPLRGLIQDHISVSVWLTCRDTFFDREDYNELLCSCLRPEINDTQSNRIETVPPSIVKPRPLWTGKQLITTILRNIAPASHPGLTVEGKSQTPGDLWDDESEEGRVIFHDSYFLCGILDKAQIGPSGKGFVHSVHEAYGHTTTGRLLSILGRLLTKFLNMRAFTCGIDDLRLTTEGNENRSRKLDEAGTIGLEVASGYVSLDVKSNASDLNSRLEDVFRDSSKHAGLDVVYNSRTRQLSSEITAKCLPSGLVKQFPQNQMQLMTSSGAKGSNVNANLISCNLGQQILEARRVPTMISGKTLPSFKPFETKIRAGGYITGRFLTGIRPQEYYFHAMAGREGLVDTAVKTASSGYLQRCLIKGMEGLRSEYDSSVRDTDGSVVQFLYGEDGLDVTKQKHLTDFRFLAQNYLSVVAELNITQPGFFKLKDKDMSREHKSALKKYLKTGRLDASDPILARYNPSAVIGSTSESFALALKDYCDKNPDGLLRDGERAAEAPITKKTFSALANGKYLRSVIEAGEAVGVVAGQSVGEPSTQMTLNTFHLAGHAAKNVTLGIPRLREIIMTASRNIATPVMSLHLIPELSDEAGERFAKGISELTMAQVIDEIEVSESVDRGIAHERAKIYKVKLQLFPAEEYCETYAITVEDVLKSLEKSLIPQLARAIRKELHRKGDAKLLKESDAHPVIGKPSSRISLMEASEVAELEGGEDDLDEDSENNAANSKQKQDQEEATTYEAPDEDEKAIIKAASRAAETDFDEPEDEGIGQTPPVSDEDADSDASNFDDKIRAQKKIAKEVESRVKGAVSSVSRFAFDNEKAEWCEIEFEYDVTTSKLLMLPLIETACRKAIIQSVDGLGECTYTKEDDPITGEKKKLPVVLTQGVNLKAMQEYQDILNPHKIFTNDIAAMLDVYGVEACRATIVREMDAVFKGHAIAVDMRHLNLIADFMTRSGGFTPFSRFGMGDSVSPFMKMSFETTMGFVRDAVLERDRDDLNNPSARIVVGKVGRVGTGAFDILMPVNVDS